jgi:hypothetical protein
MRRGNFSVVVSWRCWEEAANAHTKQTSFTFGPVMPSGPISSSNGKMTTSVPIGKIRMARQRGFIRRPEVGRADWGKS